MHYTHLRFILHLFDRGFCAIYPRTKFRSVFLCLIKFMGINGQEKAKKQKDVMDLRVLL
jgi:hypothetical protein